MTGPGLYNCPADTAPCEPPGWYCICVDAGAPEIDGCPAAQSEAPFNFCPPGNVYGMQREQCDEGERWSILQTGTGPTVECLYANGVLVGATNRNDHGGEWRWGTVRFSNCVAETCGDAGACSPAVPGNGVCVPLPSVDYRCASNESALRGTVCGSSDAGPWSRQSCDDGGVRWILDRDELNAHFECSYAQGTLSGVAASHSVGWSRFAGTWDLAGCVSVPNCP